MSRWLSLAALGLAFVTLPAMGQRGGGHGGFGGHAGFASHGSIGGSRAPVVASRGPGFSGQRFATSTRWNGGFRGYPYWHGSYCYGCLRSGRRRYYGWYGYPWSWGWYGNDGWYGDSSYQQPDYSADDNSPQYLPENNDENAQLRAEVSRLSDEVSQLREHAAAKPTTPSESDSAELVFRDKHTQIVANYAIVGQTLWLLDSPHPRKISLSELDLPATIKVNQERGVDFSLPQS